MKSNIESLTSGVNVFAAIVDTGSFAAAAERLGMSPSGVSRAIGRLEKRLKVRLLSRTTRSVTLTGEDRKTGQPTILHVNMQIGQDDEYSGPARPGIRHMGYIVFDFSRQHWTTT